MKRILLFAVFALAGCRATSQMAPVKATVPSTRDKIVAGARAQIGIGYDPAYVKLAYPGGDVAKNTGVCTDVVIRALRATGRDLQKLMHEDMAKHFSLYPSRKKWGLNSDYPMVAPNYAEQRRTLAKAIGLGTKGRQGGRKKAK